MFICQNDDIYMMGREKREPDDPEDDDDDDAEE